jgi:hypothetical protein
MISRRNILKSLGLGCLIPSKVFAESTNERKFLFIFCNGGWDPTLVFAPSRNNPHVYSEPNSMEVNINGIPLVDSPDRPKVREFFEQWGEQCLIINGIDLETVAHDRGKRLLMTGKANGFDDWGALISSYALNSYAAPYLVLSGPTFTTYHPGSVVRVGQKGELSRLLYGTDTIGFNPNRDAEHLVQEYLQQRAQYWQANNTHSQNFLSNYTNSQNKIIDILQSLESGNLPNSQNDIYGQACNESFMSQASTALNFFQQGLTRCAIVEDNGYCQMRWDSHGDIIEQTWHYDLLFEGLNTLMQELQQRESISGKKLSEEVTVIVCSELGRHPQLNEMGGKHHWPVTSAMMIGGVTGGRVIGGFDDQFLSMPIDPLSSDLYENGQKIVPGHLGATLLSLADIDHNEFTEKQPLLGVIE